MHVDPVLSSHAGPLSSMLQMLQEATVAGQHAPLIPCTMLQIWKSVSSWDVNNRHLWAS